MSLTPVREWEGTGEPRRKLKARYPSSIKDVDPRTKLVSLRKKVQTLRVSRTSVGECLYRPPCFCEGSMECGNRPTLRLPPRLTSNFNTGANQSI